MTKPSDHLLVLDDLIRSATAPSTRHVDLRNFVDLKLEAKAGRAEGMALVNARKAENSDRDRGRVRAVAGGLRLSQPLHDLVDVVRKSIAAHGWPPVGDWSIEDELRQLRKEASVTESKPTLSAATLLSSQRR